jgi:hypothetical protein
VQVADCDPLMHRIPRSLFVECFVASLANHEYVQVFEDVGRGKLASLVMKMYLSVYRA